MTSAIFLVFTINTNLFTTHWVSVIEVWTLLVGVDASTSWVLKSLIDPCLWQITTVARQLHDQNDQNDIRVNYNDCCCLYFVKLCLTSQHQQLIGNVQHQSSVLLDYKCSRSSCADTVSQMYPVEHLPLLLTRFLSFKIELAFLQQIYFLFQDF